jgi:hypothetical protein
MSASWLAASLMLGAAAHVGSPEIVHEGMAGPYRLVVSILPPDVIPGTAAIEVLAFDGDVERVRVRPRWRADLASTAPSSDEAVRLDGAPAQPPARFGANLWLMTIGAWVVEVSVEGARGTGELSVPVAALPQRARPMGSGLSLLLIALLALLFSGAVGIVGACAREATLGEGMIADALRVRRGRMTMAIFGGTLALLLGGGALWWASEASAYQKKVFAPLEMTAGLEHGGLQLRFRDPSWFGFQRIENVVPDHGHPIHLFMMREPDLDRVYHLHPERTGSSEFAARLPPLSEGRYRLYADLVYKTGLPETATAELEVKTATAGGALEGDDAMGEAPLFDPARRRFENVAFVPEPGGASQEAGSGPGRMSGAGQDVRREPEQIRATALVWLRFRVEGEGLEPYMGMAGHLAAVRRDGSVFAHLHPSGTVPMAALMEMNPDDPSAMHSAAAPERASGEIAFPYRFPREGEYRLFVQFKQNGAVHTAPFDVTVGR